MDQQRNNTPELNERDFEQLSAYIDEQLSEEERSALEARLHEDAFLRTELQSMQRTVALIRTLPPMQAPRNFTLSAADAAEIEQEEPPKRIVRPSFGGGWIAGLAAAFVIVLVGIVVVLPALSPGMEAAPQTMSVAQQPSETPMPEIAEAEMVEESAEEDFAAEEAPMVDITADQEVTQQAGQRTFSPTGTALEAIQATPIALTTLQPTFGVPRVGMTATAATQQEDAADEDTAELAASAVEATATALIESSTAADDGAAAEEGQALGGMAGGAAPEDTDDAASASEEEQAAESSLMMEQAEAEEAAESTPMPDEASAAPSTQLPEPETLLQTLLRWLIFFLQNLGS